MEMERPMAAVRKSLESFSASIWLLAFLQTSCVTRGVPLWVPTSFVIEENNMHLTHRTVKGLKWDKFLTHSKPSVSVVVVLVLISVCSLKWKWIFSCESSVLSGVVPVVLQRPSDEFDMLVKPRSACCAFLLLLWGKEETRNTMADYSILPPTSFQGMANH